MSSFSFNNIGAVASTKGSQGSKENKKAKKDKERTTTGESKTSLLDKAKKNHQLPAKEEEWVRALLQTKFSEDLIQETLDALASQAITFDTLASPVLDSFFKFRDICNIKTGPAVQLWPGVQLLQKNAMSDVVTQLHHLRIDDQVSKKCTASCQQLVVQRTPQKKELYGMSPAAARVVSVVYNPDTPLLLNNDVRTLTIEEKISVICNEVPLNYRFNKIAAKEVKNSIIMPLSDRSEAMIQVTQFFQNNVTSTYKRNADKIYHSMCTVFGGSGSGKTRICQEIQTWFSQFAEAQPEIHACQAIYIDLSNGHGVSYDEVNSSASLILGQRIAAEVLYGCSVKQLKEQLRPDLLELFDFETVMEAIRIRLNCEGHTAILLILDEFNYVFKLTRSIADNIIRELGDYMTLQKTVFLPVISGTVEGKVSQSFVSSGYNKREISLPPLSFGSIESIFKHCLPDKVNWLDFVPFRRLLLLMCSTPRALHAILTSLQSVKDAPSITNIEVLGLQLLNTLHTSVSQSTKTLFEQPYFKELLLFVLAGTNFSLIKENVELVEKLEYEGILYRRDQYVFLPYHIIFKCNAEYGQYQSVPTLVSLVPPQLIPLPGVRYTWQMFEQLDHALDPVRIAAMLTLKEVATVDELFKGALLRPTTGKRTLQLESLECVSEQDQFISKSPLLGKTFESILLEGNVRVEKDSVFEYAFLCKTGNPKVDSRLFFRPGGKRTKKPIMLIKQLKHLERVETVTTIPFSSVEKWLASTKKALSGMTEEYDILFMFITNKKITNLPKPWPKDLLLVHADNIEAYYGPFVAQLAQLTSLKLDSEAYNSEESDDEDSED